VSASPERVLQSSDLFHEDLLTLISRISK